MVLLAPKDPKETKVVTATTVQMDQKVILGGRDLREHRDCLETALGVSQDLQVQITRDQPDTLD